MIDINYMGTNSFTPLVSVAMGTYNSSKWVERAINSILNQTYNKIELIICDDCSTDGTFEIINEIAKKDKRIIILKNEINSGLNITLNNCIKVAKGEFIARMDDDDISLPHRFEKQVDFLINNPEYAFVGTSIRYFDENGIWAQSLAKAKPTARDIFISRGFAHPTVMLRKEAIEAVGLYTENKINRRGQDYDLWCKLYYAGYKGYNLQEYLFDYYESKESIKRRKNIYRIFHVKKQIDWFWRLKLPISYIRYPILELGKCLVPKSIYRIIRKKRRGK